MPWHRDHPVTLTLVPGPTPIGAATDLTEAPGRTAGRCPGGEKGLQPRAATTVPSTINPTPRMRCCETGSCSSQPLSIKTTTKLRLMKG